MRQLAAVRAPALPVRAFALTAALTLALMSGCDAPASGIPPEAGGTGAVSPFQACPPPATPAPTAASGTKVLPDLSLPCLAGGPAVSLRALGQPTVINLWASWCGPCQAELPEFQRLADAADGKLLVLGVVTDDTVAASSSLATDLGVSFPSLFDTSSQLQRAATPVVLPVTLLVGADGGIRHVDTTGALTEAELRDLVRQHLGVVLP